MRRHQNPRIIVMMRNPNKDKRYCWQCLLLTQQRCPHQVNPSSGACPRYIPDPQPHCPICHTIGGTIEPIPHHKGNKTYTYYRISHYDPTKKSKRRCCYIGKNLPPGLREKLKEQHHDA